ncbi:cytochrome c [Ramlibacter sp. XY19]|uniref:c-type cytochrome n=1 Tax=Ramlibacter paludis TaxID=2908000 RepID=UPI0023D991FC|nr:cytochrome c [Ramlibacter paludis]MCG2593656.1 cytochrome c [Ramlibacter paludis]
MRSSLAPLLVTLACAGAALPAQAQFARPDEAVKYRQGAWNVLNQHFTRVGHMVRGRLPFEPRLAQQDADVVALLARLPAAAFGPGTDTAADHARAEIWAEPARFRELGERLVAETGRLQAATRLHDLDQIKAAWGAAANTCKECHDAYRSH